MALAPSRLPSPGLAALRATLEAARGSLAERYARRPDPPAYLGAWSRAIDNVLAALWREADLPESTALVAVGGFGRREQYPYSDVDALILVDTPPEGETAQRLEGLIGKFWDVGLELGHSVRTVDECLHEARQDVTVMSNLLDARRVAGSQALFLELTRALRRTLDVPAFVTAKLMEQAQRHARHQDVAYSLEPNVKENPGGLRDLHTCRWLAQALGLPTRWSDLARAGIITRNEARSLARLERILQDLRIRLHWCAGRREDRLLFDHQETLARAMGVAPKAGRRAAERLMQRYYRAAQGVRLYSGLLAGILRLRAHPPDAPLEPLGGGFAHRGGLLTVSNGELFQRHPEAMLDAFLLLSQRHELTDFAPDTVRALLAARNRIDAAFRREPAHRARFLALFRAGRGLTHALRRMHLYGLLGRYLPAFARITGQMQHDLFHVYTVDEHILMVIRNLRRLTLPEFAHEYPFASRLIRGFDRPEVLYFAALFHDIAKGRGGDHSRLGARDARRFCRAHDLPEEDTQLVAWLVEQHLAMSTTAQKRDLSDPRVIHDFAALVGDSRRLSALYLLTMADIRGTSPKVWNAWKARLLEELYHATARTLARGALSPRDHLLVRQEEALRRLAFDTVPEVAARAVWREFDDTYFLRHGVEDIAWHTRLLAQRLPGVTPLVRARLAPHGEGIQVMIFTLDTPLLFLRICDFFERMNYDVLEARIYTTPRGHALDTFLVQDIGGAAEHYRDLLAFIEHELALRLGDRETPTPAPAGRVSRQVKHFPIEPRVVLAPSEGGQYHVLSITAADRPGLLSRIAQVLAAHGLRVHTAKIATLGSRAEDSFLVQADDDRLSDPRKVLALESALLDALS